MNLNAQLPGGTPPPVGLIVCALEREARTLRSTSLSWPITVTGPGAAGVQRLAAQLESEPPATIVAWGVAGGLDPALTAGDLLAPAEVVIDGARLPLALPSAFAAACRSRGRLVTVDAPVTTSDDRTRLARSTGAVAVDMETGHLAHLCAGLGIRFGTIRAIADTATTRMPAWIGRVMRTDGGIDGLMLARLLLRDPGAVPGLIALGQAWRRARRALERHANGLQPERTTARVKRPIRRIGEHSA